MDEITHEIQDAAKICQGGVHCPGCKCTPNSSAGMRRKGIAKAKSRRAARRRINQRDKMKVEE